MICISLTVLGSALSFNSNVILHCQDAVVSTRYVVTTAPSDADSDSDDSEVFGGSRVDDMNFLHPEGNE
jgi:hypothetical protein